MKQASHGSNLATTHPEPSYARPQKTTIRPEMVDAEDGQSFLAAPNNAYHGGSSHASPSVNEGYGYQGDNMYRNNHPHDSHYTNQAAAAHQYPQEYESNAYEQHAGEPEFEPVHQSMLQQPKPAPYNPYQQASESLHSHSNQPNYPAYESYQPSSYPQASHLQDNMVAPASSHEAYGPETSYGEAYTSHTSTQEEPPAYPLGSVEHTHSMSKAQY